ncbi:MAG: bile acid:sodium symporter, partial [Lentisphaeria bacterium]|nr:bile acid:sodium symporter [Lentisphaeria bacterium]
IDRTFILALIFGSAFTLAGLSFCGWATLSWISWDKALLAGLLIMLAAPPTLSSGIVMTQQSNGNMMLSIAITVFYNLIGIFTLPLVLGFLLHAAKTGDVDSWKMFKQLVFTVMIPLFVGFGIKKYIFRGWYNKLIDYIPLVATIMLSLSFFSAARESILAIPLLTVLVVLALGAVYHVFSMAALWFISKVLRLNVADTKAMVFCGASKSATMALAMVAIAGLGTTAAAVPCLLFYALQLFMDATLANYARRWSDAE